MESCDLQDIRTIFTNETEASVTKKGEPEHRGINVNASRVHKEWRCVVHDCSFKQWNAVLRHISTKRNTDDEEE